MRFLIFSINLLTFEIIVYILRHQSTHPKRGEAVMNEKPWIKNYDKGVPATIEYPAGPVFQFLDNAAQKYPDRACTIFNGAVISY